MIILFTWQSTCTIPPNFTIWLHVIFCEDVHSNKNVGRKDVFCVSEQILSVDNKGLRSRGMKRGWV